MITLGYSTSGLANLDLSQAIKNIKKAGYSDIELSLHKKQFNPFQTTYRELTRLKRELKQHNLSPVCISPPTYFFELTRPHDPSMISVDLAGRKQRIQLIKKAIEIAKFLEAPIVNFGSGFIREEHLLNPMIDPRELLTDSIYQCLEKIDDVILTIEPEPGMYIETLEQGVDLIKKIDSKNFQLQVDLCHAYCSEQNYIDAIKKAAPFTRYLHVADTREGYNLKVTTFKENIHYDLDFASYLIYFPQNADFLFIDKKHALYFHENHLNAQEKINIESIVYQLNSCKSVSYIDYNNLFKGRSLYDLEFKSYIFSISHFSFYVTERIKPILHFLKTTISPITQIPIIRNKTANTLTGNVHFHDIPGNGKIDFSTCFKILKDNSFSGSAVVELYNHINDWQKAIHQSFEYLSKNL